MTQLMTLEDEFALEGEENPQTKAACPCCGEVLPTFAIVWKDDGYKCGNCILDYQRSLEQSIEPDTQSWDSDYGLFIKSERNRIIDSVNWAVHPETSPLSENCRQAFVEYVRQLHRLTIDFNTPEEVVWPTAPALEYGE